jgi:hypothetical protein
LRPGRFVIPAIKVQADGKIFSTRPVAFVATKSSTGDLLFVDVIGNRKKIYVGEPVRLTLRVWIRPYTEASMRHTLSEADMWGLVSMKQSRWGVFRKSIEDMLRRRRRPRGREVLRKDSKGNDRSYYLYEIDSETWPDRPGPIDIGDVAIAVDYPTGLKRTQGFFAFDSQLRLTGTRLIVGTANVGDVKVLSIPTADRPVLYRGAVGRFEISAQALPREVYVGDPITLTLSVRSLGSGRLAQLQAPPLGAMPELTKNFKIPRESLAGVVNGREKVFTVSLRARSEKVTEIPPIPLVFFDPGLDQFGTTWTKAIPLRVKAVDKLALSRVVSAVSPSQTYGELTERSEGINANFVGPDVLRGGDGVLFDWWALAILAAGPGIFVGVLGVRLWRALRNNPTQSRNRTARKRAMRRLNEVTGPEGVADTMIQYVADRLDAIAVGMTRADVVDKLRRAEAPDELIRQTDELLRRCEEHLYSGNPRQHTADLAREAEKCVRRLEKNL